MVKPALAATRAMAVLDFFAASAREAHSMTELSRALDINAPSLLGVLEALERAHYLVRHPSHRTYVLGPAAVALGHGAMRQHHMLEVAYGEMQLLAVDVEAECSAGVILGQENVIVATAGRPRSETADVRVGTRIPLVPPWGAVAMAWADDDEVEAWIGRSGSQQRGHAEHLRATLDRIRTTGYAVGLDSPARQRLGFVLREVTNDPLAAERWVELTRLLDELAVCFIALDLDPAAVHDVASITAPVFGPRHQVALVLTLQGFAEPLSTEHIERLAGRLRASASLITRESSG